MPNRDCVLFGARLKALRGRRTLREVAKEAGYNFTWLSKVENGREVPGWAATKKLLALYGEDDLARWAHDLLAISKPEQFGLAIDHIRNVGVI